MIDILMATYNGERYLAEQIQSIQRQSVTEWRLLISDDCSTDSTLSIINEYANNDNRIMLISKNIHYGSAKANFLGLLKKTDAQYVMFCDQDDVWMPRKIEKTLLRMHELESEAEREQPLLVFTDMKVVRENLDVVSDSFEKFSNINPNRTTFPQIIAQSIGAGCTMMINHPTVEYALEATDVRDIIMHDWWISLIAAAFGKIGYVDEPTSLYRQHGDNEVGARKYSPVSKMRHVDVMYRSVERTVRQARYFKKTYNHNLTDGQKYCINHYMTAFKGSKWMALKNLLLSKCLKGGARVFGQIYIVCICR